MSAVIARGCTVNEQSFTAATPPKCLVSPVTFSTWVGKAQSPKQVQMFKFEKILILKIVLSFAL
jgi:hypothetical protein